MKPTGLDQEATPVVTASSIHNAEPSGPSLKDPTLPLETSPMATEFSEGFERDIHTRTAIPLPFRGDAVFWSQGFPKSQNR